MRWGLRLILTAVMLITTYIMIQVLPLFLVFMFFPTVLAPTIPLFISLALPTAIVILALLLMLSLTAALLWASLLVVAAVVYTLLYIAMLSELAIVLTSPLRSYLYLLVLLYRVLVLVTATTPSTPLALLAPASFVLMPAVSLWPTSGSWSLAAASSSCQGTLPICPTGPVGAGPLGLTSGPFQSAWRAPLWSSCSGPASPTSTAPPSWRTARFAHYPGVLLIPQVSLVVAVLALVSSAVSGTRA